MDKSKIKVLHINCNYITTAMHQTMIQKLNKLQIVNDVFVATYDKNRAIIKPDKNVFVSECFKKWHRISYFYKQKKIYTSVEKQIKNIDKYDCIHAYTLFTDGNVAMKLSQKYNVPYVVAIRDTDNTFLKYRKYLHRRAKKILLNSSGVFFLSKTYKNNLFTKYLSSEERKIIEKKSYIIPNGIDDFWLKNTCSRNNDIKNKKNLNIIFVGRINKSKNITTTQKALQLLNKKGINTKYTIIGPIEGKREYKRVISDKNTVYISPQKKEVLMEYYRKNDIFIMPSHHETFGLVYVEAMSQGMPVIYTKNQGFDGQFKEGLVGYHVSDQDPQSIVNAVLDIMDNYKKISNNATLNSKKFNWDEIVCKYAKIYKEL